MYSAPTVDVIKFNSDVSSDFEYYLPKIVKVFLDKDVKHLDAVEAFHHYHLNFLKI